MNEDDARRGSSGAPAAEDRKSGRKTVVRGAVPAAAALLLLAACGGGPELDTRTFELTHLDPGEAAEIVGPYVFDDRPEASGEMTTFSRGLSVRETPDNLAKIERVLTRYDRPSPGVRLHFQIVEAGEGGSGDERVAGLDSALRELFRFDAYRLVEEVVMGVMSGSRSTQVVSAEGEEYGIRARVREIRVGDDGGGSVGLSVELLTRRGSPLESSMTVPVGKTVVLGSGRPDPEMGTLILTVRPELVREGTSEDGGAGR